MDGDNGSGEVSARIRLDKLAAILGDDDRAGLLSSAIADSLGDVRNLVDRHSEKVLAGLDVISMKYAALFDKQTDATADRIKRFADSMVLLGDEIRKLNTRVVIAETRLEMLEAAGETRQ